MRDVLEDGFACGLHRIERLMQEQALRARPRRRRLPQDAGERQAGAVAPNTLDRQFEATRLRAALGRLAGCEVVFTDPPRPTPFAFPLLVERMREAISSEKLADRVARMAADLEKKAGPR